MKRQELVRESEARGCVLLRHGQHLDIYRSPASGQQTPVSRHREIADTLCAIIHRQLGLGDAADA